MTIYAPNMTAAEAIAHALKTGDTVTLSREQAGEVYAALSRTQTGAAFECALGLQCHSPESCESEGGCIHREGHRAGVESDVTDAAVELERELCAQVAEQTEREFSDGAHSNDYWQGFRMACEELATRIRARMGDSRNVAGTSRLCADCGCTVTRKPNGIVAIDHPPEQNSQFPSTEFPTARKEGQPADALPAMQAATPGATEVPGTPDSRINQNTLSEKP